MFDINKLNRNNLLDRNNHASSCNIQKKHLRKGQI